MSEEKWWCPHENPPCHECLEKGMDKGCYRGTACVMREYLWRRDNDT